MILKSTEKIEDLQVAGLRIIQDQKLYKFTTDAVLLANFVKNAKGKSILEIGAGCGVVSILICAKKQPEKILALEIQENLYELAVKNVALNDLNDKIIVENCDVKNFSQNDAFDVVVCNPPYRKITSGQEPKDESKAICLTEKELTFEQLCKKVFSLLKVKGSFYFCYPANRVAEAIFVLKSFKLEPKELTIVQPKPESEPNLALIMAQKGANEGLKLNSPLLMCDENGKYTKEMKKIYSME